LTLPIPAPRESGFTSTTETPLYWVAYGPEDADRLLVLHGGPGADHAYLLPQMLHLAEKYNVIFYDQRGGGKSKSDEHHPVTIDTHVTDLDAIVKEFDIDAPSIVAYSFGAMIALYYCLEAEQSPAIRKPARLALIDPAPLRRDWRKMFEDEFARRQNGDVIRGMREELVASNLRETDPVRLQAEDLRARRRRIFCRPQKGSRSHSISDYGTGPAKRLGEYRIGLRFAVPIVADGLTCFHYSWA
jgi:Predicted hydrolases or acyltransferases (alpha/beta hydrolase superfamily)